MTNKTNDEAAFIEEFKDHYHHGEVDGCAYSELQCPYPECRNTLSILQVGQIVAQRIFIAHEPEERPMSLRQRLRTFWCKVGLHDWTEWVFSHNNMPDDPKHWARVYRRGCRRCPKSDMEYRPLSVSEVFDPRERSAEPKETEIKDAEDLG